MHSVRAYLVGLVALCMVLATSAFALVVSRANELNRRQSEAQMVETARAMSQAVDLELERASGILSALRSSEAATTGDWGAFDRQARAALTSRDAWIVVQDRQGRQLVNTALAPGSPLPSGPAPKAMWREMAEGKPRICNLVQGQVERNVTCVDMPMSAGGSSRYAISMMFRPKVFDPIIRREGFEEGHLASLVDRRAAVIWRNIEPQQFVGRRATGTMQRALGSARSSGVLETTSLQGVPMLSAYNRSDLSGWSVIVGAPLSEVAGFTRTAFWGGSLVGLAMMVFSIGLAALLGRRLARGVNVLGSALRLSDEGRPIPPTGILEFDAAAASLVETDHARRRSEQRQRMLVGELNHRVKNTLAVVQSLAHQSFRDQSSPKQAIAAFEARLDALAAAHNLLTREGWKSAAMMDVVSLALAPFCFPSRCVVIGPPITLTPQAAVSLSLAFHELATNATKYGALSNDVGVIHVSWSVSEGAFELEWREQGGPVVRPPTKSGFGSRLIKRSLAMELGGKIDMDFRPEGLVCQVVGRTPAPTSSFDLASLDPTGPMNGERQIATSEAQLS